MTPYEEINELIKTVKETKEITLEGSDLEYFSKEQLESLVEVSQEMIAASNKMISAMNEENNQPLGVNSVLEKGTVVDFEVFIENPRYVTIGSIVEFQGSNIEITEIDLVVPQVNQVLVRGVGKTA